MRFFGWGRKRDEHNSQANSKHNADTNNTTHSIHNQKLLYDGRAPPLSAADCKMRFTNGQMAGSQPVRPLPFKTLLIAERVNCASSGAQHSWAMTASVGAGWGLSARSRSGSPGAHNVLREVKLESEAGTVPPSAFAERTLSAG